MRNQSQTKASDTASALLEREDIRAAIEAEREACAEDARELQAEMDCMIAAAREAARTVTPKNDR